MTRRNRDTKAILKTIEHSEQRSSLFWWMVKNHDELVKAAERTRIKWASFCAETSRRGLTDTRGLPATERNARETWRQARKHVAAARAEAAAKAAAKPPRPVYPSRMPPDLRPANAPPPPGQPDYRGSNALVPVAPGSGRADEFGLIRKISPEERQPYDPERNLARLRRIIDERSGR